MWVQCCPCAHISSSETAFVSVGCGVLTRFDQQQKHRVVWTKLVLGSKPQVRGQSETPGEYRFCVTRARSLQTSAVTQE